MDCNLTLVRDGERTILFDVGSGVPVVGASGAIAGVMGGYLLLFPRAKVDILLMLIIFFRIIYYPSCDKSCDLSI